MEVLMDEDAEVDETYTKNLINNVIKQMSDHENPDDHKMQEVTMPVQAA